MQRSKRCAKARSSDYTWVRNRDKILRMKRRLSGRETLLWEALASTDIVAGGDFSRIVVQEQLKCDLT